MQSKLVSVIESSTNLLVGYPLTIFTYLVLAPLILGVHVTPSQSVGLTILFTLVSFVRQYLVRRAFVMIEKYSARSVAIRREPSDND